MKRISLLFAALAVTVLAGMSTPSRAATPKVTTPKTASAPVAANLKAEPVPGGVVVVNPGPAIVNIYVDGFFAGTIAPYGTLTIGVGEGIHTLTGIAPGLTFGPMVAACGFFTWYL